MSSENPTSSRMTLAPRFQDPMIREILQRALAEYDRGELVGVAIIKEYADSLGSDHCGRRLTLLSGAARLQHRLNLIIDKDLDDVE